MSYYSPATPEVWSGRTSGQGYYYHERITCADLETWIATEETEKPVAILGYASDEGVRRNQGRVGAKEGPAVIRERLGKFVCHAPVQKPIIDFGDVVCEGNELEKAHELVSEKVQQLLAAGCFPILLGGGHDLGYAHCRGIFEYLKAEKPTAKVGVVNLDAHFDLRAVSGERNSGTPFYQLSEEYPNIDYLCLGIQPQANDPDLFAYAHSKGHEYLTEEECKIANWKAVNERLEKFATGVEFLYLTIDLDGFSSAYAPGVSAPSPVGLEPNFARKVIEALQKTEKLISTDIVELNPLFDQDLATARLAAWLVNGLVVGNSLSPRVDPISNS
ncbi:formimidoylglutamase [Flammeovirgaceae bacterium SG7u.111]|nr:formimidoylglutamase [Flammeovirgaceae bacterium SG7u.132]WPO36973.1 formimidoylglutamase [Flammeovirgaceae bacterium SG7u.111]